MASLIDFHTHILPGMDDGSQSTEESLKLLALEAEQQVNHVVLTPHFYAEKESLSRFLDRRRASVRQLTGAIDGSRKLPRLSLGAEVRIFEGISHSEFLPELAITGTKCILIEMPMPPWSDSLLQDLERIRTRHGLVPIVAHIDRYISPLRTRGIPETLHELPVLVQASADFFLARNTRNLALKLLRERKIHLLGSDCHNLHTRVPNMADAVAVIEGKLGTSKILNINTLEARIFAGESTKDRIGV